MTAKTAIARERSRERNRARRLVRDRIGLDVFMAAQDGKCSICMKDLLLPPEGYKNPQDCLISIDHVYDLASHARCAGNLLLAHQMCNQNKDNRHPTRSEQVMLGLVNRCLGYRKGVYKAARVGKGIAPVKIPHPDFHDFMIDLLYRAYVKVFHR